MDYIVCESDTLEHLQRRVNEYLRLQYHAIGGVAVARERVSGPLKYCQAVLKNGTEPEVQGSRIAFPIIKKKRGRPPKIRTPYGQSVF